MKKRFLLITGLVAFVSINAMSQKVFATKSGEISFDATGTCAEAIKASNYQVDTKMVQKTGQIVFSVLIKSFKFPNTLMQDHFNENYMESSKFPKADFKGYITNIASVSFDKDGTYNVTAEGILTIGGKSNKVSVPGTITIEKGNPTLKANFKIKVADYVHGSYIGTQIASEAKLALLCKYE